MINCKILSSYHTLWMFQQYRISQDHKEHFQCQCTQIIVGEHWGARDGAVVRALASHQCGPGSNPSIDPICGLSFSPGTPVFPSPQKTNISKFYFDQESGRRRTTLWMGHLQIIYFIYSSPMLYTVEPRNKEPLCNEVLGITISFAYHSNIWKRTSMK